LQFKSWGNAEVATEWFCLGIRSGYKAVRPPMKQFLLRTGRRKFLEPIYSALKGNHEDLIWAKEVYAVARNNYHPVAVMTIDEMLGYQPAADSTN
jgi:hypothetical protein